MPNMEWSTNRQHTPTKKNSSTSRPEIRHVKILLQISPSISTCRPLAGDTSVFGGVWGGDITRLVVDVKSGSKYLLF